MDLDNMLMPPFIINLLLVPKLSFGTQLITKLRFVMMA